MVRRLHPTPVLAVVTAVAMTLARSGSPQRSTAVGAAGPGQDFAAAVPTWQVYPAGQRFTPAAVTGKLLDRSRFAAAYPLGMGLPFIGFAAGVTRLLHLVGFVRRHGARVTRLGGALLVAVGLALATGARTEFINWLRATAGPGGIGI